MDRVDLNVYDFEGNKAVSTSEYKRSKALGIPWWVYVGVAVLIVVFVMFLGVLA